MKRGAEKYLTDRNAEEEDDNDEEVQIGDDGFSKAPAKELARRPIRGLPGKRSSAASTPAASPSANGTGSAFSFGPSTTNTGFSFGSPQPASTSAPKPSNSFSFANSNGTQASFASTSAVNTSSQKQTAATMAGSDADITYYASLRGLNMSVITPLQNLIAKDPFLDLSQALEKILNEYRAQRGKLGKSHKSSVRSDKSQDRNARSTASDTGSSATKPLFSFSANPEQSSVALPPSTLSQDSSKQAPAPASSKPFSGFSFAPNSSSTTATEVAKETLSPSNAGSSAAAPAAKSFSGFSFGSHSSTTPSTPSAKPAPVSNNAAQPKSSEPKLDLTPPTPPSTFSFAGTSFKPDASKAKTDSTDTNGSLPAGSFVFNPSKSQNEEKSTFSFPAATSVSDHATDAKSSTETANSSVRANNLSGSAAPFMPAGNSRARQPSPLRQVETAVSDESAKRQKEQPHNDSSKSGAPKPFEGFAFGGSASSTPAKATSFGSGQPSTSPKASGGLSFGASNTSPKGFTSNVGFSFGSSTSPAASPAATSQSSAPLFSFSTKPAASATTAPTFGGFSNTPPSSTTTFSGFSFKPAGTAGSSGPVFGSSSIATPASSQNSTPAPENEANDNDNDNGASGETEGTPENALLKGGVGEEEEETLHEARTKLWKNETKKIKDGDTETETRVFNDYGINIVKINRNTATGKVRMLGRSDANGRVQINFVLYKNLKITLDKSVLSFLGFEDGSPKPLRLKLRNPDMAQQLKDVIEREIANLD